MYLPLLSILIPTTLDRTKEYSRLIGRLNEVYPEINKDGIVEEITDCAGKEVPIGEKREGLYRYARGLYSWQIDDDDDIAGNSIKEIIGILMPMVISSEYINPLPSCITFRENCMINGQYYSSNHSLKYDDWAEKQDGFDYVRTPFYKDVIRTDIARSVPFERIRYGEDIAWARALKPHLRNEVHIDQEIYFYIHESKPEDHNERYGYDKD